VLLASALAALLLPGCMTVRSTAAYYLPTTQEIFAPKPKDAPIPILAKPPQIPYRVIGKLAFSAPVDFAFMRKSMEYNARANGADAVLLKDANSRQDTRVAEVPPRWDYEPVTTYVNRQCGRGQSSYQPVTTYVPVFRPGYLQRYEVVITGIDAEMLKFKK